ncbi:type II secretion system protein [Patescibacteria group bacterium]|nr:MAG: type II secretion system protein [Patescibacteria group bacterium]
MTRSSQKGFTLLELLIVMALIAILVGIALAALNPGRQFANARNSTRYAHVTVISNAISANMAENNGVFTCAAGAIPATATNMANGVGNYDIAPCLVTEYMSTMPYDPSATGAHWTSETDYDTGYDISEDASDRITIAAPGAELSATISLTR